MFEVLFLFGIVALGIVLLAGVLNLLAALLLLPLKLLFWTAKGLIGLLLLVPMLVIGALVVANLCPIILLFLLLPVLLVAAGVVLLLKLIC
ncbi:MAG: hypothetical protein KAT30_10690 [Candidatus Krumholzibacteria bacterium]|nr:hypothetical protein [Candidatus Krumholzibacteria bacterium]MCK5620601.1 hypothetical protein [Candidatus Krumholzibacteria bacterium]